MEKEERGNDEGERTNKETGKERCRVRHKQESGRERRQIAKEEKIKKAMKM